MAPIASGRLGNPDLILQDDPRLLPALRATLVKYHWGGRARIDPPKDPKAYHAKVGELDAVANELYETMPIELPGDEDEPEILPEEITIDGSDGNKIKLYFFRPPNDRGTVPVVFYFHGGGMMYLKTMAKPHVRWVKSLALRGVVSVAVDFRNVWNDGRYCPFPAGLNDCAAAVKYVYSHRKELGISKIVIQGESGGANLVLATALKAKKEGWSDQLAGVYAYCPYIAGAAHSISEEQKLIEMPSAVENEGYIQESVSIPAAAEYYSPGNTHNPLAWPYFAKEDDLRGLPPHALSMDEMDTLRDEGVGYYRKLLAAGVKATAEIGLGMPHGSRLMFRQAIPEEYVKLLGQIVAFANGV